MKLGSLFSSPSHHASTPRRSPEKHTLSGIMLEDDIEFAESVIRRWVFDLQKQGNFSTLFAGDRVDANRFLKAVGDLQRAMLVCLEKNSSSEKLIAAQELMPIAINRLEKEFYLILSENRKNFDSDSLSSRHSRGSLRLNFSDLEDEGLEDDYGIPPLKALTPVSDEDRAVDVAMADLRRIAECMITCGYTKECVKIYKNVRKSIVDEAMHYLAVEKLNHTHMQKMEWDVLEVKIKNWLRAVKTALRTLFQGEKILCETVFASSERITESCFAEICKDAAVNLFSFPENFAKSNTILSPEKIFRTLDLYEAITDLWQEIDTLFWHELLSPVKAQAVAALLKLGEAVRLMLSQLETAIQKDSSKTLLGGGVHPLTRYVMNFLNFLGDYTSPVSDIFADCPVSQHTPLPESYFSTPTSAGDVDSSAAAITVRVGWLILVLLCKLDGKAVMYNDVALSYLFLANNLNYVVSKIRNSNLGLVMGPDWITQHRGKVNRYLSKYERTGWTKTISTLPQDPAVEIPSQQIANYLKQFNINFIEAYKKQISWVIHDPEIRDRVKTSLAKLLILDYQVFYEKYRSNMSDAIVLFTPKELDNHLSDLFLSVSASGNTTLSHSYNLKFLDNPC